MPGNHFLSLFSIIIGKFRSNMKLQRPFLIIIFFLVFQNLHAQPKWMVNVGGGFYEPTLTGFDSNTEMPETNFMTSNVLYGFGLSYEFFHNARVGLLNNYSLHSGSTISGTDFSRTIAYRTIVLETYFMFFRRFEMNFTLGPMINGGTIRLDASGTVNEWDTLLSSFGNNSIGIPSSEKMTTTWFGFTSMIGLRFYVFSWLALDVRSGFMNNWYDEKKWKFQGETVTGPKLKLDELPLFTFRLFLTW